MRRPVSPRRNQPPTRSTPRSVCTLSPTCTRISVMSSISTTAPSRSPAFSFSKKTSIVSTAPMGGVYRRAPATTFGAVPPVTHPLWPLFDLRIRSEHLVLRLPTDDELVDLAELARSGIHGEDEMPFGVPWSTRPSPKFEIGFVQHHWGMR